ncbi:PKD domain-containing protein [Imperialibacter roseus]|uniref:PKD domain-containing protein n=1 Tax=Imperialibacter roseus TaxID=1324217 RepID=A0ABZ0IQE3_9BACT|nr:PKD domain-containing protein [Imperialibacter roseus]WOK06404.1 PKD domain-containing protein [Imperialibacter roseus]
MRIFRYISPSIKWLRLGLLLIALLFYNSSRGQVSVSNRNIPIDIHTDAIFFIPGSYTDNSTDGDGKIILAGTLIVNGDISNNGATTLIAKPANPGTQYLTGTGDQTLAVGTADTTYLANFILSKPSGSFILPFKKNVLFGQKLTFSSGKISLVNSQVYLKYGGALVSESLASRFTGIGFVSAKVPAVTTDTENLNIAGMGLIVDIGSDGMGASVVTRYHIPAGIKRFDVANDATILKYFEITFGEEAGIFDNMTFNFFSGTEEMNSLGSSALAVYTSSDNGSSWLMLDAVVPSGSSSITNSDVKFEPNSTNLIVVAETCDNDHKPKAVPTSNNESALIQEGNTTIKVCYGGELDLSSTADYHHWIVNGVVIPSSSVDTYIFDLTDPLTDGAKITLFERNNRGCEKAIEYTINVLSLPIADFSHSPENDQSCYGADMRFLNESLPVESGTDFDLVAWYWDFKDNDITSTLEEPTHVFSDTGKFAVTLVTENRFGCSSTGFLKTVRVNALPIPDFDFVDLSGTATGQACQLEKIGFTNKSYYQNFDGTEILSPAMDMFYQWDFGNGYKIVTPFDTTYTYNSYGEMAVRLIATVPGFGCTDSLTRVIKVDPRPVPAFRFIVGGGEINGVAQGVCEGVDILLTNDSEIGDDTPLTYRWDFGDESDLSEEPEPIHEYLYSPDNYRVSLEATSVPYGCVFSDTIPLTIHPAPTGDFHMEFDELAINDICSDVDVDFINNSDIADGSSLSYAWNFNDGSSTFNDATLSHAFSDPRVHTISLTRTTEKLCSNTVERYLTVHAFPVVDFVFNDVCDGLPVAFYDASSVQTDAISSYHWEFSDGGTSDQQNPQHEYATFGSYAVKLTAANTSAPNIAAKNAYSCVASAEKTVEVFQRPSFNIGPLGLSCSGSFTIDPSTDPANYIPPGTSFTWYNALGQQLSTGTTLDVYESGVYKAVLTTDNPQNCESSFSIPVYIVEQGDLGANRTVCESTVLDATPANRPFTGAITYQWAKDGSPLSENSASLLVTESGNYSVTVTYSPNSGTMTPFCSYSDDVIITIDDVPALDLGDDVLACQGETTTLVSNISGDSYVWVNIASGDELGYNPTLEVAEAGQYQLRVEAGTCSVSDVVSISLLAAPEAGFLASALRVCEGEEVSFTDISFSMTAGDPIVARQWSFDNGETADTADPSITYLTAGTYSVELEIQTQNGCTNTSSRDIVVDAPPAVSFDAENACQGTSVGFTNTSTTTASPVTYLWTFGDGTTSTQESPLHTFDEAGLFDVTLKITSGKCTEEYSEQIEIYPAPELDFASTSVTCGTQLILDAGSPGAIYRWYDVASGSTLGANQTYMVTANMAIGVEVTTPNGCLLTDETTVTLNSPVQIDLGPDREVCGPVTLDAGAFPNGTYAWSTGETTRKISVTTSGLYSVSFVDQNGCTDSDEVFITVSPLPSVDLGENITACSGSTVTLNAKNPGAQFLWSTGERSQSIAVAETGTYTVRVSVGNCWVEDAIVVSFLASPELDIAYTGQCEGDAISFEPIVSNDTGTLSYLWSFGDGTQSANSQPDKIFSVANTYNVTVVATNADGCKAEVSKLVAVQPSPKPNFVFKNVCEDEELVFTNTTSYAGDPDQVSYTWDFGDGNTSEAFQPTHSYQAKGRYFVTLAASTDAACERTQTKEIVVNEGPSLNLPESIETCESTFLLDAGNPGNTYKWQNNSSNRTYLATQSGTYTVRVTNTNGCAVSGAVEVTLLESELPNLGEDREACGDEVLDPMISAASYLWSTGQTTPTITANETGTYWVETISNDLCIHRDTVNLIVYPRPVISLGDDIVLCKGEPLTLDATSDIASTYKWSNGSTGPLLAVTSSGTYGVTLTSPKGCTFYEEIKVTVNELPALAFAEEYEACESLLLGVTNIRSEFLWSTGSTEKNIKITESDTYWLKISDRNGCVNADTAQVVIRPKPTVDLGPDVVLCYGETVELDAGAQAGYLWNDLSTNRLKSAGATGSYTVTVTNEFGCENSDKINVTVKPTLGLNLAAEALICSPEEFFLDAGVADVAYAWTSNTGYTSTDKIIYPTEPGTYYLQVTATDGCVETDVVEVKETTQKIKASFLIPSEVAVEEEVHFVQLTEPEPISFKWTFGDGFSSVRANPSYIYYRPADYTVSLTVSNGVCSDTEEKLLRVLEFRPSEPATDKVRLLELYRSNLYPNPAEDVVKIDLELSDEAPVLVQIFNLSGLKVAEYEFVGIEEVVEFNMSGMTPGSYIMAIQSGRISKTIRFVKTF